MQENKQKNDSNLKNKGKYVHEKMTWMLAYTFDR